MDEVDVANRLAEIEREVSVRNLLTKNYYNIVEPKFNEANERVCVDCDVLIPQARVSAINAVRCIECARIEDNN